MNVEPRLCSEGFPTRTALIWLLSCVNPLMGNEVIFAQREFPTFSACEGSPSRVEPLMLYEACLLPKGFTACVALVWLLSSVSLLMDT